VSTPVEAVQDLSAPVQRIAPIYTDFRQKHVTVQSLRPGDVLEFKVVTTVQTPLAPGQFWSQYQFEEAAVVLDEQFELDVPAGRSVTLKLRPGFETTPQERAGRTLYRWTRSQLKGSSERQAEFEQQQKQKPKAAAEASDGGMPRSRRRNACRRRRFGRRRLNSLRAGRRISRSSRPCTTTSRPTSAM
jgi:hypothetical protein